MTTGVMQRSIKADYSLPPLESWEFAMDNNLAAKAMKHLTTKGISEITATRNALCARCAGLNFWSSGFANEDNVHALARSAANCDLFKMLRDVSQGTNSPHSEKIRFERNHSVITVTSNTFPVLSLIRSPGEFKHYLILCIADYHYFIRT